MRLSVIDTPGFGDRLNRQEDIQPILDYIDQQNQNYLKAERFRDFREYHADTRVHLALYFVAPTGTSLKELDIFTMRQLATKVNLIPIIAKADSLTLEERLIFKDRILSQLEKEEIKIYPFSHSEERTAISHLEVRFFPGPSRFIAHVLGFYSLLCGRQQPAGRIEREASSWPRPPLGRY